MKNKKENKKENNKEDNKENNPRLEKAIGELAAGGEIDCAKALQVAAKTGESPQAVGSMLDQLGIRIVKCQLGLFGCADKDMKGKLRQVVVTPEMEEEIRKALQKECLPCKTAWAIAVKSNVSRTDIAAVCDCLKIKIKPCQLGAF